MVQISPKQKISKNNTFEFRTIDTVVKLESSGGKKLSGGKTTYYNRGWEDFGITDISGEIHREILPGIYIFDIYYDGKMSVKQDNNINPIAIFKTGD